MRNLVTLGAVAAVMAAGTAWAQPSQAPRPLPASIRAVIGLPGAGPARYANVTIDLSSGGWSLEGCESTGRGACRRTRRIVLAEAQRQELVRLLAEIDAMPRCEPEAYQPGDPEYELVMPAQTWTGHLPRNAADVPSRTQGTCAAPTRLAWWILQWFGVPGLTAPQGGGGAP